MKNPIDVARFEMTQAKAAYEAAGEAITDFQKPFETKQMAAQSDISHETNRLRELREAWAAALDNCDPTTEIEEQIRSTEAALKTAQERLRISREWHAREGGALKGLQQKYEEVHLAWINSYRDYMDLQRENLYAARELYLQTLADYWEEAREAGSHFKIPKFGAAELEVEWGEIRQRTGSWWS